MPLASTPHSSSIVTFSATGARSTSVADCVQYFLDPIEDVTETAAQRTLRLGAWQFCLAVCFHHPHLRTGLRVGDIAGIVSAITTFALRHGAEDSLDAVRDMTTLHKKGKSWREFVETVAGIRRVFARNTDPRYHVGEALLPGFVLRAMDEDNRYHVELTLLRCTFPPPDIDHIMANLAAKDRTLTKSAPTLYGLGAAAPAPPAAAPTNLKVEPCRNFATTGICKFHKPSFGRFCRHSHGAAADKQTALDRATYKAKGRPPRPPPVPPPPPPKQAVQGHCYRCGSALHGIDDCTEDVTGAAATTLGPATNAQDIARWETLRSFADKLALRAKQNQVSDVIPSNPPALPAAFAAAPAIGPPNAYNDMQLLDDELARLFGA
jgi:hypothetical protein